jgi:serine/threonine-protein kinase HipA
MKSKIKNITKLLVTYHGQRVGTLMMSLTGESAVFQYAEEWLRTGFSISPLELPLEPKLFIAPRTPFYGNFGIFEDSMPDGYGRYLLNRILREQGVDDFSLTPLQRLAIVGAAGMGALCYEPAIEPTAGVALPELDELQQLALDVLSEKQTDGADVLYFNSGNSGGCRPKCLLHEDGKDWLVKFRHTYDPKDIGEQEYYYMQLAAKCGIEIPECRLIQGKYFASQRFDRTETGERIHVATAAALLTESINPPKMDYKTLLSLTGWLTQSPQQVEQMFRRMVYNVLIENKDDHAKNFTFMWSDGKWCLAPAYDLLPCLEGYHGQHATSVMGKGNPTEEDMIAAGESIRIHAHRSKQIIDEIRGVILDL